MGTLGFKIKPHADIELGFCREDLDYYVTLPVKGVTDRTGLILSIPGFGGLANSTYQIEKLNPYLAEKYNCIVVSLNYFGIYRGIETIMDDNFLRNMEFIYGVPSAYWSDISSENDFYVKLGEILESKGVAQLDPRCQALKSTARNEYQSFGFLPALDCLTVLGDVIRKYPNLNKRKIIAYGSSYGGYIAMLCGKFAPNLFSVIIDNSGFSRAQMKHIVGREILEHDYVVTVNYNNKPYTVPFAYNNPWTILDDTSPFYFGDSHKQIRNLLLREHRVKSDTRYYIFHCEEDQIASVEDKDKVAALLSNYNSTYYKRVGINDLDGVLFKKYTHAMNASLRKLFDYAAEQDKEYGLEKRQSANEFSTNNVNILNCGSKNYIFNFKEDFTMDVTITENIKTDYNLIFSLQLMRNLLDICESIDEGFDFIVTNITDKNYNEAAVVMQDIVDAHTTINLQIDTFSMFLSKNNLHSVGIQFKDSLLEAVVHFNNDSWDLLNNQISQQTVPDFLLWKNELQNTFSPYLNH
ncbi:hypothetical protein A3844_15800 [Paenibacillus helianthi]|uniref:DUF8042 domain-containing protein n=1 Tax=Paenibacillus helianthi TaxID=1349432 RepID=A0ABX3ELV3_9BACL|nr:DUF2920 family protein [Paenibacillus helianthi]OKP85816.1 hypothetical protein A3844_15800 [Paenibacillus helianthi]